jgi:outer membrane protein assembly factor BamB
MSPERPRWFRRRIVIGVAAALVLLVGAAAVFALSYKAGDVSNPDVEFRPEPTGTPVTDAPPGKKGDPLADFVWADYGYTKDRRHYLPASFEVRPPFKKLWTRVAPVLLEFPPVMVGPRLVNIDNSALATAYAKRTGRRLWNRKLGALAASSPGYGGGRVYFTVLQRTKSQRAGRIVALDIRTGKVAWSKDLGSRSESSPLYVGGRIYFGSESGVVYAMDARTGALRWKFQAAGPVKAALALSGGNLYFGTYGGRVYSIRVSDGRQVWSTGTSGASFGLAGGNFYSTAAVAFGRVYVGNTDGRMYSFSAGSGKLAWARATGAYVYSSPAAATVPGGQPTVWFGSYNGTFYALDAKTGGTRWTFRSGGRILGAPTVVGNLVYFSDYGTRTTYALGARTGARVWKYPRGAFNPVISDGRSIFLTGHSAIYAFRPRSIGAAAAPKPMTAKAAKKKIAKARKKAKAERAAQARKAAAKRKKAKAAAVRHRAAAQRSCTQREHPRRCFARWTRNHPHQAALSRPRR